MRIALAQINPTVGDLEGNADRIRAAIAAARQSKADLVLLPELAVTGYPPKDLLLKPHFVAAAIERIHVVASECHDITAIVGTIAPNTATDGKTLHNAAVVCAEGRVEQVAAKTLLPVYDVFDETRYFAPAQGASIIEITTPQGLSRVGISICEDLWNNEGRPDRHLYSADPIAQLAADGAELIVNISASPYCVGKQVERLDLFSRQMSEHHTMLAYVNQVGGNDDLIFDGGSLVMDATGQVIAQAARFREDLLVVDTASPPGTVGGPVTSDLEDLYAALVLGVRDYVQKCGFSEVVLGLSGGIDSAVTAVIATDALGPDKVHGVALPARHSSAHSLEDAAALAATLGIDHREIPIEAAHGGIEEALAVHWPAGPAGTAEENLQARLRGNILMALSNKFGWLLLTTGNKSELAVGYCTLYGDMCGGLAVISDVPKTTVYQLARHINAVSGVTRIPARTLEKAPSAELRPDQTDQDTLPPYETLDAILERYVEREQSADGIIDAGFDAEVVRQVVRLVDLNEYKRKQAATGLRVTSRAFGTGRRMPIAARYT